MRAYYRRLGLAVFFAVVVAGAFAQSQPPTPTSGARKSDPPNDLRQNNQASASVNSLPNSLVDAPNHQRCSCTSSDKGNQKPSPDWWLIRLTAALVFVGLVQAGVYICQAWLMRQNLAHVRESSEKQLRAYLSFSITSFSEVFPDQLIQYRFEVTNHGPTPAKEFAFRCYTEAVPYKEVGNRVLSPINEPWSEKIADIFPSAHGTRGMTMNSVPNVSFTKEQLEQINHGDLALIAALELRYRDVFEDTPLRITRSIMRIHLLRHEKGFSVSHWVIVPGTSLMT